MPLHQNERESYERYHPAFYDFLFAFHSKRIKTLYGVGAGEISELLCHY